MTKKKDVYGGEEENISNNLENIQIKVLPLHRFLIEANFLTLK